MGKATASLEHGIKKTVFGRHGERKRKGYTYLSFGLLALFTIRERREV